MRSCWLPVQIRTTGLRFIVYKKRPTVEESFLVTIPPPPATNQNPWRFDVYILYDFDTGVWRDRYCREIPPPPPFRGYSSILRTLSIGN